MISAVIEVRVSLLPGTSDTRPSRGNPSPALGHMHAFSKNQAAS
jgi:hypothetical protein